MQNNQKLSTQEKHSKVEIPDKWKPKYIIKRIGDKDIVIPPETRDVIVRALQAGVRFVQVGEYTLMLNSISSINPYWGANNIPKRPEGRVFNSGPDETYNENQAEIDEWDRLFGDKKPAIEEWSER